MSQPTVVSADRLLWSLQTGGLCMRVVFKTGFSVLSLILVVSIARLLGIAKVVVEPAYSGPYRPVVF